jgi:ketosteroid isomerase-like protein
MRHLTTLAAVSCLFLLAAGAALAAGPPKAAAKDGSDPEEARVRKVMALHVSHFNAGDWEGIRSEYTEDALLMHQFSPDAVGPDSIANLFREDFKQLTVSKLKLALEARVDEARIAGPWAFSRGVFIFTASDGQGNSKKREIRFLEILQKQSDGSWKTARSIDNTSEWPYVQTVK